MVIVWFIMIQEGVQQIGIANPHRYARDRFVWKRRSADSTGSVVAIHVSMEFVRKDDDEFEMHIINDIKFYERTK